MILNDINYDKNHFTKIRFMIQIKKKTMSKKRKYDRKTDVYYESNSTKMNI